MGKALTIEQKRKKILKVKAIFHTRGAQQSKLSFGMESLINNNTNTMTRS